jgi:hypothetical protein
MKVFDILQTIIFIETFWQQQNYPGFGGNACCLPSHTCACFSLGTIPDAWKASNTIMIPTSDAPFCGDLCSISLFKKSCKPLKLQSYLCHVQCPVVNIKIKTEGKEIPPETIDGLQLLVLKLN